MVNATSTTVEIPSVRIVTAEDIYKFCKLTGDTNKAHEGDRAAVPAFYIDWVVKNTFDVSQSPDYVFSRLDANFREVIRRDEPFCVVPKVTKTSDGVIQHEFQVIKGEVLVADGTIEYRVQREQPRRTHYDRQNLAVESRHGYTMDQIVTGGVKQTLNLGSDSAAKLAAAISRTSNALLNTPKPEDQIPEQSKIPFYGAHKLQVYPGVEEALAQQNFSIQVRPGDKRRGVDVVYVRGMSLRGKEEAVVEKPFFDLTAIIFYLEPTA
ncbi:MAG: hypothetical protein ACRD5H_16230 [Nitrososphaerales archaeon]